MASYPGVARVTVRYTRTLGDDMVNVLHIRKSDETPYSAAGMALMLAAIRDGWWDIAASTNDIRALTSNEVTLADLTAVSLDPSNIGLFTQLPVNQAGSSSGDNLSPQLAPVVSHRTDIASRSARGRTYHVGLTATHAFPSSASYPVLTAPAITALQGAWNGLDAALSALAAPAHHVIASEADEVARQVTARVYTTKIYSQRRRN